MIGWRIALAAGLIGLVVAGDYAGACAELDRWVYQGATRLPGLVKRRADERARCEGRL